MIVRLQSNLVNVCDNPHHTKYGEYKGREIKVLRNGALKTNQRKSKTLHYLSMEGEKGVTLQLPRC